MRRALLRKVHSQPVTRRLAHGLTSCCCSGALLIAIISYVAWQEAKAYILDTPAAAPVAAIQNEPVYPEQPVEQLALIEVEVDIDPAALNALPMPYRSKRFYRQVAGVWQPTTPGVEYWGQMRTLETVYFHLEFYERDAAVVEGVALDLDGLWQTLHHQVGLAQLSPHEKVTIQVLPNSGHHRRELNPFKAPSALPVSSPIVLPIPTSVSEIEMLRGDIARHLVTLVLFHKIDPAVIRRMVGRSRCAGAVALAG